MGSLSFDKVKESFLNEFHQKVYCVLRLQVQQGDGESTSRFQVFRALEEGHAEYHLCKSIEHDGLADVRDIDIYLSFSPCAESYESRTREERWSCSKHLVRLKETLLNEDSGINWHIHFANVHYKNKVASHNGLRALKAAGFELKTFDKCVWNEFGTFDCVRINDVDEYQELVEGRTAADEENEVNLACILNNGFVIKDVVEQFVQKMPSKSRAAVTIKAWEQTHITFGDHDRELTPGYHFMHTFPLPDGIKWKDVPKDSQIDIVMNDYPCTVCVERIIETLGDRGSSVNISFANLNTEHVRQISSQIRDLARKGFRLNVFKTSLWDEFLRRPFVELTHEDRATLEARIQEENRVDVDAENWRVLRDMLSLSPLDIKEYFIGYRDQPIAVVEVKYPDTRESCWRVLREFHPDDVAYLIPKDIPPNAKIDVFLTKLPITSRTYCKAFTYFGKFIEAWKSRGPYITITMAHMDSIDAAKSWEQQHMLLRLRNLRETGFQLNVFDLETWSRFVTAPFVTGSEKERYALLHKASERSDDETKAGEILKSVSLGIVNCSDILEHFLPEKPLKTRCFGDYMGKNVRELVRFGCVADNHVGKALLEAYDGIAKLEWKLYDSNVNLYLNVAPSKECAEHIVGRWGKVKNVRVAIANLSCHRLSGLRTLVQSDLQVHTFNRDTWVMLLKSPSLTEEERKRCVAAYKSSNRTEVDTRAAEVLRGVRAEVEAEKRTKEMGSLYT